MLDAVRLGIEKDRVRRAAKKEIADVQARLASLSQREKEVMVLVAAGRMNKQIAGGMNWRRLPSNSTAAASCAKWERSRWRIS